MALGLELQTGLLTQQYNVCGSTGCRCKADPPQKHGPYYQLSFHAQEEKSYQFVRWHDLSLVQEQVRNYQRWKKLTDRWVALGMALSHLRPREQHEASDVSQRNLAVKTRISGKTLVTRNFCDRPWSGTHYISAIYQFHDKN